MDTLIKFRVATEDKARFELAAKREGRKLSDWCRRVLLDASRRDSEMVEVPKISPDDRGATVKLSDAPREVVKQRPPLQTRTGGLKRTQEIPVPDWKKRQVEISKPGKKVKPQFVNEPVNLTREQREAKTLEFQRGMGKKK